MTINDDCYYQHQMTTAPASDLLSGKGADTVHSLVRGSKHSTSVMVILNPIKTYYVSSTNLVYYCNL